MDEVRTELESSHTLEVFTCIDAPETSVHLAKVPEGISWIEQLCAATGVDIATLTDPHKIMAAFAGKHVQATVVHKTSKGAPIAVVKAITAPAASQ